MSRSWKIAVSQRHKHGGEWRGSWRGRLWRCRPSLWAALLPSCTFPSRGSGRSWRWLCSTSSNVQSTEEKLRKLLTLAKLSNPMTTDSPIQANYSGQRTWDTGSQCGTAVLCGNQRWSCSPSCCNYAGLFLSCLSEYINGHWTLTLLARLLFSHYSPHMFYLCCL